MRKSLIIVLALAVVFSLGLGVMADDMGSKCCPTPCPENPCEQDVNVQAPFLLECYGGSTPVELIFGMNEYEVGYIDAMEKMTLKVGAPANWLVGAIVDSNPHGIADALLVSAGAGWKDVSHTGYTAIKAGGQGVTIFPIHYRITLDDLTSGGADINNTVTVTYNFM